MDVSLFSQILEVYGVGALGTVSLAIAFLWILTKYLPKRDAEAMELHKSYSASMAEQAREYKAAVDKLIETVDRQQGQLLTTLDKQQDKFLEEIRHGRK